MATPARRLEAPVHACRFCGSALNRTFVDLGATPPANSYLRAEDLDERVPAGPGGGGDAVGLAHDHRRPRDRRLHDREEREMTTAEIGSLVSDHLRRLDQVAYVRFASVYRNFEDVETFMDELKHLIKQRS